MARQQSAARDRLLQLDSLDPALLDQKVKFDLDDETLFEVQALQQEALQHATQVHN